MKNLFKFIFIVTIVFSTSIQAQDIFSFVRKDNVTELSKFRSQVNSKDEKGYTPLILAVYNQQYANAKWLLENGANPDLQDNSGNTALMGSIFKGYDNLTELLIAHKANINLQNFNGATALIFAATFGKTNAVKTLLENGADKNIKDSRGNTALQHATMQENKDAIALLNNQ